MTLRVVHITTENGDRYAFAFFVELDTANDDAEIVPEFTARNFVDLGEELPA